MYVVIKKIMVCNDDNLGKIIIIVIIVVNM